MRKHGKLKTTEEETFPIGTGGEPEERRGQVLGNTPVKVEETPQNDDEADLTDYG